jgi:hypothetical protein
VQKKIASSVNRLLQIKKNALIAKIFQRFE